MLRLLTSFCIATWLAPAVVRAAAVPAATLPAEIHQLKGKVVKIYHDVDLRSTGKPSSLHTSYLIMILEQAGATVLTTRAANQTATQPRPNVVIFGDMPAPPRHDPAEAADPFIKGKLENQRRAFRSYTESRRPLEKDAAAAGARVIRSADVAAALGIRVSDAQMVQAFDARAAASLERMVPGWKADAMGLMDAVNFLRKVSGANIFVNWRALEAAGIDRKAPITLNFEAMPLAKALDKVLAQATAGTPAKLGYAIEAGVIEISTDGDLKNRNHDANRTGRP